MSAVNPLRICLSFAVGLACVAVPVRAGAQAPAAIRAPLPASSLASRVGGVWRTWWRSERAPARWAPGRAPLVAAIRWHEAAPGVEWSETVLRGSGSAWRTLVAIVRLDPEKLRFRLDTAFTDEQKPAWKLGRVPPGAVFAVNAGQFVRYLPWGWVVLDGRQFLPRGRGPLVNTIALDPAGLQWLGDAAGWWARPTWAFQSYPTLLAAGQVPEPLSAAGAGIDVAHRDARAALGRLADGRLLVAMTRFDLPGLGFVPFGLTVPEMAAVMGALGARDAVLLDGGISAQMLVRGPGAQVREWPGIRAVPLALVAFPR